MAPVIPVAPPPAAARSGPENGADLFYDRTAMAASREEMRKHHGGLDAYKILVDQAEAKIRNGRDGYGWDAQAWYGGDVNKLWIKTEGEGVFGEGLEAAEVQALWSRALDPWFDLQLGVRYDIQPDPERAYLVAGIQGLAPYWFEVDGSIFLSNKGDLSARFEGEYDLRITQRLILQPMVEFDLVAQDVPELGIGSGLSEASIGARLRYEIFTGSGPATIAPYVGIEYERAFGDTADFRRSAGEDAAGWNILVGLRTWF
jgi:copper resistance protein B